MGRSRAPAGPAGPAVGAAAPEVLFRQADLLPKSLQPRIATNHGHLGIIEALPYPQGAQDSHAIKSFQGAILVTQGGQDQNLCVWSFRIGDRQSLRPVTAAGPRIGVAEKARTFRGPVVSQELDRLRVPSLA